MFYVMNEDVLSIFDDDKEKIETTRKYMPQLTGLTLETDIVDAETLEAHPNKVIVDDIPVEIDVPDYEESTEPYEAPIYDENGFPVLDENEEQVTETQYRTVAKPIMIEDENGNLVPSTHKETIIVKGLILNPDFENEEATRREAEFNKAFFNTSLGYIRRAVTMKNGSHKDFLSDLLPAIFASVSAGKAVNLYAYDAPPFDEDVIDWTEYQHLVVATPQFINECFEQLGADFAPINEEA